MAFRYKKLWHQLIDHDMSRKSCRKALALSLDFIDRMHTFLHSRKAMESILEFEDDVEAFEAMLKATREQQQKYKEKGVKIKNAISYDMESPTFNGKAFRNVVACGFCDDYKQPFRILRARRWHRRCTGGRNDKMPASNVEVYMNMAKKFVLAAGLTLLGGTAAFGEFARGYFNNWADDCQLTQTGDYYSGTLQAHAGGSAGLKFDLDGNWGSSTWGGTSASAAIVNQTIGSASWSQSDSLPMDVSDGYYYTFHLAGDYSWGDRSYVVMKTKYQPSTILDVVDDSEWVGEWDVTLTATCSAGTAEQISPEETYYILYTTDGNWDTAELVEMSGSGLMREGKIPGQTAETTVQYKVFSTTMPKNCFTTDTILSSPNNIQKIDFCMISLKEGSYTVPDYIDYVAGNAWHCPKNTEPYASETMRTPGTLEEVALGDHPYVRLGVNPTSGSDAPTMVQLKYKAGTNRWETLTMEEPEPHGDGWLPKYDGNDYYASFIPTDKFEAGMTVQYYFYLEYANSSMFAVTSVGTTDQRGSIAYLGATEAKAHPFMFTVGEPPPEGFNDPQGTPIEDPAVIEWLTDNGFTQADIDALGKDAAATAKLYECYLGNCDFRMQDAGASLGFSAISVNNDVVSITVQLVRKAPFGTINGVLNFYGADDLADGFGSSPIAKESVSFGEDDAKFAIGPTDGSVTQTATANIGNTTEKFFKAEIEVDVSNNEDP